MLPVGAVILGCAGAVIAIALIIIVVIRDCTCSSFSRHRSCRPPKRDVEAQSENSEVSDEYEKYGELVIQPDRQPTRMGLDIITRTLMGIGLPPNTTHTSSSSSVPVSWGPVESPPRLSLYLACPSSLTPSEQVHAIMTEAEASTAALNTERFLIQNLKDAVRMLKTEQQQSLGLSSRDTATEHANQRIRAGHWVDVAREDVTTSRFIEEFEWQELFVVGDDDEDDLDDVVIDPMSFTCGSGKAMAGLYR
ncbi:Nn.00g032240.m01.CDS01 [Neocucurbitaria sp. VM-36]